MTDELDWILARVASGELTPEDAEPLVAAVMSGRPGVGGSVDADAPTRTWEAVSPPPAPPSRPETGAGPTPAVAAAARTATRAVRIQVTDGGRAVVNLRVPMSLASLAGSVIPGLSDAQVGRLQQALRDGEIGTIVDVRDDQGSGVLIATE
jgi:hypothetical protein